MTYYVMRRITHQAIGYFHIQYNYKKMKPGVTGGDEMLKNASLDVRTVGEYSYLNYATKK